MSIIGNSAKYRFDMTDKQTHKYVPQLRSPEFADSGLQCVSDTM